MLAEIQPFDPYTYPGSENVKVLVGVLVTVASMLLFAGINLATQITGPPRNLKGEVWRWRNTFISWIHADIIGLGVLYSVIFKPEIYQDLIVYCDYLIYLITAFSLGYFLYDFIDFVWNNKHLMNWEVILHHICVIWTFAYHVQYRVNIGYTIIALLTEVNSIFLHARKLMQLTQWSFDHWLYNFVLTLNLFTFVFCRLLAVSWIWKAMFLEWHRVTLLYKTFMTAIMLVMSLINPVLFWRLVKSDLLRNIIYGKRKMQLNGADHTANRNGEIRR